MSAPLSMTVRPLRGIHGARTTETYSWRFRLTLALSALLVTLSWALAQNASAAAPPRALGNGQSVNPRGLMTAPAGQQLPMGTVSGTTRGPQENSFSGGTSNVPQGFLPPVTNVSNPPNSPLNFQGEVAPNTPGPGNALHSGLSGSNSSVNTSPFAPADPGAGPLGSSPSIGTGSPNLGTNGSTSYVPPAQPAQ